MAKTTKKDFELFKKECLKWIKIFGLYSYETSFEHDVCVKGSVASCEMNINARWANLGLAKKPSISSKESIKLSAFHEVMEVFIGRLRVCALSRFVNEDEIEEANHEIIRTLENVVYPKLK